MDKLERRRIFINEVQYGKRPYHAGTRVWVADGQQSYQGSIVGVDMDKSIERGIVIYDVQVDGGDIVTLDHEQLNVLGLEHNEIRIVKQDFSTLTRIDISYYVSLHLLYDHPMQNLFNTVALGSSSRKYEDAIKFAERIGNALRYLNIVYKFNDTTLKEN